MKKLFLTLTIVFAAIQLNAQTMPGVGLTIENMTPCTKYVRVTPMGNPPSCNSLPAYVIAVPAHSVYPITGISGIHYEIVSVADTYPVPTSFYVKIKTPTGSWGWSGLPLSPCIATPFPQCDDGMDCSGMAVEACWDGSANAPIIRINN